MKSVILHSFKGLLYKIFLNSKRNIVKPRLEKPGRHNINQAIVYDGTNQNHVISFMLYTMRRTQHSSASGLSIIWILSWGNMHILIEGHSCITYLKPSKLSCSWDTMEYLSESIHVNLIFQWVTWHGLHIHSK